MFELPVRPLWCRSTKKEVRVGTTHLLRDALRNYIDVLYNNPNPDLLEKAYKEIKDLSPEIDREILISLKN